MGRKKYEARHEEVRITTIKKKIVVIAATVSTLLLLFTSIMGSAYMPKNDEINDKIEDAGTVLYIVPDSTDVATANEVEVILDRIPDSELDEEQVAEAVPETVSDTEAYAEVESFVNGEIETEFDDVLVDSENYATHLYTPYEFSLFTRLLTAEAGGEEEYGIIATAWVIRNRITSFGGYEEAIFYPNAFEPANVIPGEIASRSGYVITDDDVPDNVRNIARGVLEGEIPSPVADWEFFIGFQSMGYESGDEFAAKYAIKEYCVIGNTIFFKSWNDELNSDF